MVKKRSQVPFWKFQAVGNDFVVIPADALPRQRWRETARKVCDRRLGIGADGLLVVGKPGSLRANPSVSVINADGSGAEISGNGLRCVGAYLLRDSGWSRRDPLWVRTRVGLRQLVPLRVGVGVWVFRVDMGKPVLAPSRIPFQAPRAKSPVCAFPLRTSRGLWPVTVASMGNPHCTVFVSSLADADWAGLGAEIERMAHFPKGTNVEFVKVVNRKEVHVRFWERGVGMTLSSGSGSSAAVVAAILNGFTERDVQVVTPAGEMRVAWPEKGSVFLTGPVELIAGGTYWLSSPRHR